MTLALVLRYWWVAALAGLAVALGVQTVRLDGAQRAMSDHLAEDAIATAAASERARQKEQADRAAYDEAARLAREEYANLQRDFDDLAGTADSLRDAVAVWKRRAAAAAGPAVGGTSKPGSPPAELLADLYLEIVRDAQATSKFADGTYTAGATCERASDAVSR